LEGLRGEDSIAELCRKEGIAQNRYYRWSKDFLEAGKKRLSDDTTREANTDEVKELRSEARQLKEVLAEQILKNRLLKKSVIADGNDDRSTRRMISSFSGAEHLMYRSPHPRCRLLQDQLLKRQIGHGAPEPVVLRFQLFQPFDLIALEPAVFRPPPVVRGLSHTD
jgi:transposase